MGVNETAKWLSGRRLFQPIRACTMMLDLNPVFARTDGATAADVRIIVDFAPPKERYRPTQEEILLAMNRIMQPDAVAVIGATVQASPSPNTIIGGRTAVT